MNTVLHLERKFTSPTETFIVNQIDSIRNFKVIVATTKKTNYLNCNCDIVTSESTNSYFKGKYLTKKMRKELFDKLKSHKIDLIHTHYLVDAAFFTKFTKMFKVPKICSVYGYDVSSFPNKYFGLGKYYIKRIFDEYDVFLAMSMDMKNDLLRLGCPEKKIKIHYQGIDIHKYKIHNRDYGFKKITNILQIGTVESKKGQNIVLESLYILLNELNIGTFVYHVVGNGNIDSFRNKIDELKLKDKIKLYGYINHKSFEYLNILKQADIYVHPSITSINGEKEGIPTSIIEAMASGLPVLSTYHAGIPYIIENDKDGLLVNEKDIKGLANALNRLILDFELREKLGKAAQRKAAEQLSLEKGTRELEGIYKIAIEKYASSQNVSVNESK